MCRPSRRPSVRYSLDQRRAVAPRSPAQPSVLAEEGDRSVPQQVGRLLVVGLGPVLVEEGVAGSGVEVELDVLAQRLQLGLELAGRLGGEEVVLAGGVAEHGRVQLRVVGLGVGPRDEPVGRHDGLDRVGALGGQHQGQPPAHAEPDHPHLRPAGAADELVDRPAQVLGRGRPS